MYRYRSGAVAIDATRALAGLTVRHVDDRQPGAATFKVEVTSTRAPDGPVVFHGGRRRLLDIRAVGGGGWVFRAEGVVPWAVAADRTTLSAHLRTAELSTDDTDFLLSTVIPRTLTTHGLTVLHAAGIIVADGAVLVCGRSGAGKSTLAAAFHHRRAAIVLGDDAMVLDTGGDRIMVWSGDPDLRLWDTTRAMFGSGRGTELGRYGSGTKARHRASTAPANGQAHPVRAVLRLRPGPDIGIDRRRPAEAVVALSGHLLRIDRSDRRHLVRELPELVRLAEQVPVFDLVSPRTPASLDGLMGLIEGCVAPTTRARAGCATPRP